MKHTRLILLLLLSSLVFKSHSQIVNSVNYPITTATNVPLENMTGATTVFASGVSGISVFDFGPMAMGFKFCLGGYCYDSVLIGVEGRLRFTNRSTSFKEFPAFFPAYRPTVMAMNNISNTGTNGYVQYLLTGTAPNRKFIVHYKLSLMAYFPTTNPAPYEFQIVLHENGSIAFNYGNTPASWAGVNTGLNERAYMTGFSYNLFTPQASSLVCVDTQTAIGTSTVNYASTAGIYNREVLPPLSNITFTPPYSKVKKPPVAVANAFSKCVSLSISDTTTNEYYMDVYRSANGVLYDKFISRIITNTPGTGQNYLVTDTTALPLSSYTYAILSRNLVSVPDTVFISATTTGPLLSGVKNIPGDYGSLTEALEDIRCKQLNGDIYLELNNAYTSQNEQFPLEFDSRINASAGRRVIIRPAAAATATILNTSDNMMLKLRNFSFLELDGRPGGTGTGGALSLVNDTTPNPLIYLGQQSDSCMFRYCNLQGRGCWDASLQSLVVLDSVGVSHHMFDHCDFAPSHNQYWLENVIYSKGSNASPNHNNTITQCSFANFGTRINRTRNGPYNAINGIDLQQGNKDVTITHNSFFFTDTLASNAKTQIIFANTATGSGFRIDTNYFGGTQPACAGQKSLIHVYGGMFKYIVYQSTNNYPVSVCGNTFRNIRLMGDNIFSSCCGEFNFIDTYTNKAIIKNNCFGDSTNISSVEYSYPISNYVPIELYLIGCGTPWGPYQLDIRDNSFSGLQFRGQFDLFCTNIAGNAPGGNKVEFNHNRIGGPQDSSIVSYSNFYAIRGRTQGNDTLLVDSNTVRNAAALEAHAILFEWVNNYQTLDPNIGLKIRKNSISRLRANGVYPSEGIQVYNNGTTLIEENDIHTLSTTGAGRVCGITTNFGNEAPGRYLIRRNYIHHLYNLNPAGEVRGIQTSMNCDIENNMIALGMDENGLNKPGMMVGMFLYSLYGDTTYYRHNSVHVGGGVQNHIYNQGLALLIQQNVQGNYLNVIVENNILSANRFGNYPPAFTYNSIVRMPHGGIVNTLFKCDHNQYYADTTNYFMEWDYSLSGWQSNTGLDANSFMNSPCFVNPEGTVQNTNLHLLNFNYAESAGTAVAITEDFDNDYRPGLTPVDIGADAGNYTLVAKLNLGPDVGVCSSDSVILDAGNYLSYLWSTGAVTRTIAVSAPGQYIVNVINGANLPDTDTINVFSTPGPTLTVAVSTTSVCAGSPVSFSLSGATSYSVNGVSCVSNFTDNPTTGTVYTIAGQGVNGCMAHQQVSITVFAAPSVSVAASSSVLCAGQTTTLSAQGASTYTFSGGTVVSPAVTTTYSVAGASIANCLSAPALITITVNPLPVISATSGSICTGQSFTIVPSGAGTYTISGGNYVVSPPNTTSYSITGTSTLGCDNTMPTLVTVNVYSLPNISVNSGSVCAGNAFTITPSGALSYTYSSASNVVAPAVSSVYSVTGSNSNGCSASATSSVTVYNLPLITASTSASIICAGGTALLTAQGGVTYFWPGLSQSGSTVTVSPGTTASYLVTGTDANGCENSATVTQNVSLCTGLEIPDPGTSNSIRVFPNPSGGIFHVQSSGPSAGTLQVFNSTGQLIWQAEEMQVEQTIDLSRYARGIYFLRMNGQEQSAFKLIRE